MIQTIVQTVVDLFEQNLRIEGHDAERLLEDPQWARQEWAVRSKDRAIKRRITRKVQITKVAEHRFGYDGQKVERLETLSSETETLGVYSFHKCGGKWIWVEVK